ncbi:hypothetical protein [Mycobacteroides abscessus]|uniref:hypothetical protein n=1 Tax=Mycobacteroides abscessus TaxID=36809 RepID=UPI001F26D708|nr:hypothetical protein [Mycobacteroides abscessus]MDO3137439.1 hypothetical protein [Mycobacteroides abscessus subsp. abscessus]MDO3155482.1 hypothetical protein [Mycobacteroides abscessus subsp. abscessus]
MLAGSEDPGVLGAVVVGSWWAVAELTAVAMSAAAAGRSGRPIDGMRGRTGDLASWRCSDGWWACAPCPAGVSDGVLGGLALVLGAVGVPDGLVLPATRLDKVGFTEWGLAVGTGVPGALVGSAVGVVVARGIGGSS